ncbi:MAG: ATP-binding cassette domain-containing protein [Acidobacteriota bacterium]|nr:ATP-binding cassette domain-containing protein [Acidobacteriota bacterium]
MTARLTVQVLPAGDELFFDGDRPVVIGRDRGADVVVSDERASRRHAVVRPDGDAGWVLEDHSSNGTFSSGERVAAVPVEGSMLVHLGDPQRGAAVRLAVAVGVASERAWTAHQPPVRRSRRPIPMSESASGAGPSRSELGEFSAAYEPATRVRIGRAADNDIVVADLLVSRHHAELRQGRRGYEIVDLGSANGVFVDGGRVARRAALAEGSIVSIGHHLFRLWQGRLEEYVDSGQVSFSALDLAVRAGSRRLLDDVSFILEAGQFLAVLGPTGAGKSTLMRALIGSRPADSGQVLYNGRDVYANYAELRNRIAYVPQDDLLHSQLTVRDALEYAAALRFPPDVSAGDRRQRVVEIMAELGLSERAGLVVDKLSGGQRKRTSVAIELLTRPSLLVLDEPTSGLDPGYEKSVMELLRSLADGGRTVITVTHSVQSLGMCDRILFLAPGGQTAFFGPPSEALDYFDQDEYADVFRVLDRSDPGQAKASFCGSEAESRYVRQPLAEQKRALAAETGAGTPSTQPAPPPPTADFRNQFATLVRRYVSVIVNDRRNTALLLLQAPVLGLLMMVVLGHGNLNTAAPTSRATAGSVLVALVLGSAYLGASNAVREIVKERSILARELSVGVSPLAYILSKAVVLGVLTVAQSLILVVLGVARQGGPQHGALFGSGRLELFLVVSMTGVSAMALGLLISALVSNGDKALTILPVVLFAQFVMTGAAFNLTHTPVLGQVSYLTSARWGYSGAASTVDLDAIQHLGCNGAPGPGIRHLCDATHRHSAGVWLGDELALAGLSAVMLAGAWRIIVPLGRPSRR